MHTLYTYGYTGGSYADLESYVRAGALIQDIRFSPNSRVPQWRKAALEELLGENYAWLQDLGNRNYRGGEMEIDDLVVGLEELAGWLSERPVVLLCACAIPSQCHRSYVADQAAIAMPGLRVVHLRPGQRIGG